MNKTDVKVLKRGLRRMGLAILTVATFLIAVAGFIATALATGYLAVLLFLVSLFVLAIAYCMLYGYGMDPKTSAENVGDDK
jgi:uncharacterized membrane protein